MSGFRVSKIQARLAGGYGILLLITVGILWFSIFVFKLPDREHAQHKVLTPRQEAALVVQSYVAAWEKQDWKEMCSLVGDLFLQMIGAPRRFCPQALQQLFGADEQQKLGYRAINTKISGASASVVAEIAGAPFLFLLGKNGEWKIIFITRA